MKTGKIIVILVACAAVLFLIFSFLVSDDAEDQSKFSQGQSEEFNTILYDNNGLKITAVSLKPLGQDYELGFLVENTGNEDFYVTLHAYGINGIMGGYFNSLNTYCNVGSGKKANTTLNISENTLSQRGITSIKYFDLQFDVGESNLSGKKFDTGIIRLETANFTDERQAFNSESLFSDSAISVYYMGTSGNTIYVVVENTSDKSFAVGLKSMYINDYSIDGFNDINIVHEIVFPESEAILEIEIYDSFYERNQIETANKIDFDLSYNFEDDYDFHDTDTITIGKGE